MIRCISILQDSYYVRGTEGGWPSMSKNYKVSFRNMWVTIMMPVALKKDHRLGEVGLSVDRTDILKRKHRH
jgi:hypothetical protein